jgi:hypothetical protein
MRRQVAAVLVGLLVLSSGCSLFDAGTPTGVPSPTATATGTPTTTPAPYPAGYADEGVANATAARDGHLRGVLATGNYSLGYNATIRDPNGTRTVTVLQFVSPGEPRALTDTVIVANGSRGSGAVRRARFYANGTQYVREQRAGNTTYGTIDGELPPAAFAGRQYVDPALTNVSYDSVERIERDGETFFRLRASEIEDPGALLSDRLSAGNVTAGNVTLTVGPEGIVRSLRYRATVDVEGRTVNYGVSFAVAGIDRTPVERPEWAQEG